MACISQVAFDPRWSPKRNAILAASTYIRPESSPYQDPSCMVARVKGSKRDGTHLISRIFQPRFATATHPPWIGIFLSPSLDFQNCTLWCYAGLQVAP
jgi:hypothetical protein